MVTTKFEDGFVSLYLEKDLILKEAEALSVPIGTDFSGKCDYTAAFVGKGASLIGYVNYALDEPSTLVEVYVDGIVEVDVGGKIAGINLTGGTYSGVGL